MRFIGFPLSSSSPRDLCASTTVCASVAILGTSRTAVVKVNEIENGTWISSRARPRSSADVVMKKNENADMIAKNRTAKAMDCTNGVPKMKFMPNMKTPSNNPPRMDISHRPAVFAINTSGIWERKIMRSAKMLVNISAAEKNPIVTMNFDRGSSRWMGLLSFVNLKPCTNFSDI